MWRTVGFIGLSLLLLTSQASALSSKDKMQTCKYGADDQKLTGAARNAFIKKCMGHGNYQPQARKDALKAAKTKPKTTAAAPKADAAVPPPPKQ